MGVESDLEEQYEGNAAEGARVKNKPSEEVKGSEDLEDMDFEADPNSKA